MKCPVCKSSVESFYNSCNTCGLPFPGSEWFFNSNDFNSWRKSVQNASIEYSERDNESDDYTCIRIINSSSIKMSAKRDGSAAKAPYPISLSLSEAANGTVTSLFINEPNKTGKTMAVFHLPPNILSGQILTMKSGTTFFYLIVNVKVNIKDVSEYTCLSITNPSRKQLNPNGNGYAINSPYPIYISLLEAANGIVVSLYIKTPNKTEYTLANFHIPQNVLNRQILTMKSGASVFYLIVNITDIRNPNSTGSKHGKKRTDKLCLAGMYISFALPIFTFISSSLILLIILPIIDIALCEIGVFRVNEKDTKGKGVARFGETVACLCLIINIITAVGA